MLGWMRGFIKTPWAFALFALLVVSFGVFYSQDPFKGVSGGGFVTVGSREVTQRDVNRETENQIERIRQEQNQVITAKEAAQRGLTQQVFQSLVYRNTVLAYADQIGVKASPSAVSNLLAGSPRFKDPLGRIDMNAVRAYAAEQKTTWPKLEQDIRDDITFGYIQEAAFGGIKAPEVLVKPMLAYYGEQRTLTVARISEKTLTEPKPPTPEEIKTYYDANKDKFRQPERRRISVLSYSAKDYVDKVNVTEEQVQTEFNRRIREFSGPESRDIVQYTGKDRATVQNFVDTVKQGNSLEAAAAKVPGITGTGLTLKPGDLTDKSYNDQVFSIPASAANQLLGPVKVGEIYYAIELKKITPGAPRPFAEVAPGLRETLRNNAANKMFSDSEESFYDMAGGTSLEEIGKNIGAPIIQLAPVDSNARTRNGLSSSLLLAHPEEARSLFTLGQGQMTDVINSEITDNQTGAKLPARFIFRVDEILPPAVPPVAEIETQLRNAIMAQKVQEAADKAANSIVAAVKAGTPFAKAAADQKMSVLPGIVVNRAQQQQAISPTVVTGAYELKQGDIAMIKGEGSEPWVVQVDKVEPVSPETQGMIRQQLGQQIEQSLQNSIQEVFFRGVQSVVKPKLNDKAIKAYFDSLTKEEAQ